MIKSPKDAVVSARLHHRTKEKLVKSGYTPAEAIEWFVHVYYENNPQKEYPEMVEFAMSRGYFQLIVPR